MYIISNSIKIAQFELSLKNINYYNDSLQKHVRMKKKHFKKWYDKLNFMEFIDDELGIIWYSLIGKKTGPI